MLPPPGRQAESRDPGLQVRRVRREDARAGEVTDQDGQINQRPGWFVKPRSRRLVEAAFVDDLFLHLFSGGEKFRVDGDPLPDDVRIVGVEYSIVRGAWLVYLESEAFEPVPENMTPPEIRAPIIYAIQSEAVRA